MVTTTRPSERNALLMSFVIICVAVLGGLGVSAQRGDGHDHAGNGTSTNNADDDESGWSGSSGVVRAVAPDRGWLGVINQYRREAGVGPVRANRAGRDGVRAHACWMVRNTISHDPRRGTPGWTPSGDRAAASSNLAVSETPGQTDRTMISYWMSAPFHAIGVLRPALTRVSYGRCEGEGTTWRTAVALNVVDGIDNRSRRPSEPIVWPGNGQTTSMNRFIAEQPDPVEMCRWKGDAGLPVIAMMPETPSAGAAWMTGPDGRPLEVCTLWRGNTVGTARAILASENALVVVPRRPLLDGRYSVKVWSGRRVVSWSFGVETGTSATKVRLGLVDAQTHRVDRVA